MYSWKDQTYRGVQSAFRQPVTGSQLPGSPYRLFRDICRAYRLWSIRGDLEKRPWHILTSSNIWNVLQVSTHIRMRHSNNALTESLSYLWRYTQLQASSNKDKTEILFGLCNAFRRVVSNFASVMMPLNKISQKITTSNIWKLTEEKVQAIKVLQNKLISPPTRSVPRHDGSVIFNTDAWNLQVGCVHRKEQKCGSKRPAGYCPHSLDDAQSVYGGHVPSNTL